MRNESKYTEKREEKEMFMEKKDENKYADKIEELLKNMDFRFIRIDCEDEAIFILSVAAKNVSSLSVKLLINNKGDFEFKFYIARNVPEKKRMDIIEECNHLHNNYHYITLSLDESGTACATYDFLIFGEEDGFGELVLCMLDFCAEIADECVPYIMETLRGEEAGEAEQPHIKRNPFQTEGGEPS